MCQALAPGEVSEKTRSDSEFCQALSSIASLVNLEKINYHDFKQQVIAATIRKRSFCSGRCVGGRL